LQNDAGPGEFATNEFMMFDSKTEVAIRYESLKETEYE